MEWPRFGRVVLKPFSAGLSEAEWKGLYETFRDPEVAEWNGSSPLRSPFWLFKRFVLAEARRKDRVAFVILDEKGEYLGTLELYDLTPEEATLGILIGRKDRWGLRHRGGAGGFGLRLPRPGPEAGEAQDLRPQPPRPAGLSEGGFPRGGRGAGPQGEGGRAHGGAP